MDAFCHVNVTRNLHDTLVCVDVDNLRLDIHRRMWLSDTQSQTKSCRLDYTLTLSSRDRCRPYDVRGSFHAPGRHAFFRWCSACTRKCADRHILYRCPLISLLLQILFISGLTLIIGPHKTFYFFARKQKIRGTICFIGGILLVFLKWPFIGMIVETFGFLNLFGYGCVNFCVPFHSAYQLPWFIQGFLSSRYYFPATAAILGDLFIAAIHPGCKFFFGLGRSNAQIPSHVRWWIDLLDHEHLQYDYAIMCLRTRNK